MSRQSKIEIYLTEYHGGFLTYMGATEAQAKQNLAESVTAYFLTNIYHVVPESTVRAYVVEIDLMIAAGDLELRNLGSGWAFVLED